MSAMESSGPGLGVRGDGSPLASRVLSSPRSGHGLGQRVTVPFGDDVLDPGFQHLSPLGFETRCELWTHSVTAASRLLIQ